MIDHLGYWRRVLRKESKCEILKYFEPLAAKGRNQYLFHCSRWLTEGGQTSSGSQRTKECEMSNWLTSGSKVLETKGAKDNQGEGIMPEEIKSGSVYIRKVLENAQYVGLFYSVQETSVLDSFSVFYWQNIYKRKILKKIMPCIIIIPGEISFKITRFIMQWSIAELY